MVFLGNMCMDTLHKGDNDEKKKKKKKKEKEEEVEVLVSSTYY